MKASETGLKDPYGSAIAAGVRDKGYRTVRCGGVEDFSGVAVFEEDGKTWRAEGFGPTGTASWVHTQGYIEFQLVD